MVESIKVAKLKLYPTACFFSRKRITDAVDSAIISELNRAMRIL
jgi:hypothetical protein